MATPSVHSIRSGEHEDFEPGQHPLAPGRSSFRDALTGAQRQIDQYGRIVGHYPNVRQEGNRAVDDRSWWEKNSGWLIPALMLGGSAGVGALLGPAAAGASAGSAAANAIPFGVGPTTFGAGSAAGSAAAGLTPSLLAENAALGGAYGAGTAGAAGTGAATASGARNALSQWGNIRDILGLGVAGVGALQGFRQPEGMDDLRKLFGLSMQRSEQVQPLFDQLVRMTSAQLPDYTRQG